MAARALNPLLPGRILATGTGAFVALYVLTAAYVVVKTDTQSAAADTPGPAEVTEILDTAQSAELSDSDSAWAHLEATVGVDSVTLSGTVASQLDSRALVAELVDQVDVTLIHNKLEIDPAVAGVIDARQLSSAAAQLVAQGSTGTFALDARDEGGGG